MEMDFEKICRTCLSGENSTLVSIFENNITDMSESESSSVIDLLTTLTNIKISANDCLPEQICSSCIDEMKRAYSFKLKCENAETVLNKYLDEKFSIVRHKYPVTLKHGGNIPYLPPDISITIARNESGHEVEYKTDDNFIDQKQNEKHSSAVKAEYYDDDDIVFLSDDETNENHNSQQEEEGFGMSNEYDDENEPYRIEISDDEAEDDDGYTGSQFNSNGAFPILDYNTIKRNTEFCDSQSSFLMPDNSNDYSSQYDASDDNFGMSSQCPKCSQMFDTASELKRHIKDQHTRGLKCTICKRVLKTQGSLSAHITTHVPQFYPCPICGFKVKQRKYLTKHLELHSGNKTYKCELCGEEFLTTAELRGHNFLSHSVTKDSPYKCDICGVRLPNQRGLNAHKAKHNTVVRNHVCDVCNKAFRDKTGLNTHYRIHTGEKPHTCKYCRRSFTTQYSLKMHVAIHTNEEFHKCAICFTKFRYRSAMIKHMELHREN